MTVMFDDVKALLTGKREQQNVTASIDAHPARWARERLTGLVKSVLPRNFKDEKWRRVTWPGCPACQHPLGLAYCARPVFWMQVLPAPLWKFTPGPLHCDGDIYLDIETGLTVCSACDAVQAFADSSFMCNRGCGALFRGGELWQGMTDDIVSARRRPWMHSMKARVTQEIVDCGWAGMTRLKRTGGRPRCGCQARLYRLDGAADICGNCLQRWLV